MNLCDLPATVTMTMPEDQSDPSTWEDVWALIPQRLREAFNQLMGQRQIFSRLQRVWNLLTALYYFEQEFGIVQRIWRSPLWSIIRLLFNLLRSDD